jgi:2-polyprenyl-3-methyl-5-hydroxy-6-metoxy-1,4-benzoquinol methylase
MTFEHLYDPFSAADEMTRLLAPGGIVIIMTVWSWRYHTAPGFDDYWRFSNTGLEQLFPALEIVESGFDLSDRRKDGRLDRVPVDVLGGWREHWYVYLVARKPTHATARIEGSNRRSNLALLGMSLDQIKEAYSLVLESSEIASVVSEILEHGRDQQQAVTDMEQEERAWPGESRFVDSGYYRQMLGRYAFAGSQFCRDADVLETGCGLGWGAYLVGHYARHVTAFDLDPVTIQYCAETWKTDTIRWLTGDARDLGFLQGQRYDVCLGMETIEHFSAQDGATYVAAVASVLRPGGIFIGTSAFPESQQEALAMQEFNPYHPHIFTHDEMLGLLKQHFNRAAIIGNWMFIAIK